MALTTKEQQLVDITKTLLGDFQRIRVHNEVGFPKEVSGVRSKIIFTYDDWVTSLPTLLWMENSQSELESGVDFTFDVDAGHIDLLTSPNFPTGELPVGAAIEATYHFKYFDDEELLDWMEMGLIFTNNAPPHTAYPDIDSAPQEFTGALIIYTYFRALQRILLDNQFWNNNLIYADSKAFHAQVHALKVEAENEWKEEKKRAKPRSLISPRGVTGGQYMTQQRVTASNFRRFTIIG